MNFNLDDIQEVHFWTFSVPLRVNGEYMRVRLKADHSVKTVNLDTLIDLILVNTDFITTDLLYGKIHVNLVKAMGYETKPFMNFSFNPNKELDFLASVGISEENRNMWRCSSGEYVILTDAISRNLREFLKHFISEVQDANYTSSYNDFTVVESDEAA